MVSRQRGVEFFARHSEQHPGGVTGCSATGKRRKPTPTACALQNHPRRRWAITETRQATSPECWPSASGASHELAHAVGRADRTQCRRSAVQDAARRAEFLTERYSKARGGVLAGTIEDLIVASSDPSPDHVRRATDQFARFLADENLIAGRPGSSGGDLEQTIRDMLAGRRSQAGQEKVASGVTRQRR